MFTQRGMTSLPVYCLSRTYMFVQRVFSVFEIKRALIEVVQSGVFAVQGIGSQESRVDKFAFTLVLILIDELFDICMAIYFTYYGRHGVIGVSTYRRGRRPALAGPPFEHSTDIGNVTVPFYARFLNAYSCLYATEDHDT